MLDADPSLVRASYRGAATTMLEAIALCEQIAKRKLNWTYQDENRIGDHIWWISDVRKFCRHYPGWQPRYGLSDILTEIHDRMVCVTA